MEALSRIVDDLELSTTSFCSDFLENPPTHGRQKGTAADQLRAISGRLSVVLSKIHYAANAIKPPNELPPELLRAVFSHLRPKIHHHSDSTPPPLPYADLFAISCVCRYWREVAVSSTELWAHIILTTPRDCDVPEMVSIARLCARRSGARPLDFFYTPLREVLTEEQYFIPGRHRLRSVVYGSVDDPPGDELARFLLPALHLERLYVKGVGRQIPSPFSNTVPRLRELALSRCTLGWPNPHFNSLTSLSLLRQRDIDADIYPLLEAIRCSPRLEELFLDNESKSRVEQQHQPPGHDISTTPLHSLKRLHVCRLSAGAIKHLFAAFVLLPSRVSMRFADISADFGAIFPETITPLLSPRAATKLELIYPGSHLGRRWETNGAIIHATNGTAHMRWTDRSYQGCDQIFRWIGAKPHGVYTLKEVWLHIGRHANYELLPRDALRDLEKLVIENAADKEFDFKFSQVLSPGEDGVPFPLLSTLELRNVLSVEHYERVLEARSAAGSRLRVLRMRWSDGREAMMAPLAQFVDKLEFYHATGEPPRGLELPKECTTRAGWWEPWPRGFGKDRGTLAD